jgi:hypothetical protein
MEQIFDTAIVGAGQAGPSLAIIGAVLIALAPSKQLLESPSQPSQLHSY